MAQNADDLIRENLQAQIETAPDTVATRRSAAEKYGKMAGAAAADKDSETQVFLLGRQSRTARTAIRTQKRAEVAAKALKYINVE